MRGSKSVLAAPRLVVANLLYDLQLPTDGSLRVGATAFDLREHLLRYPG